jgi:alpha-glucosidase (family GH31 glycosyl hydrolase)
MRARVTLLSASLVFAACSSSDEPAPPTAPPATVVPEDVATGPCGEGLSTEPQAVPAIHTPRWAFEPWISKDISSTDDTYAFVDGFEQRGIPLGVVVLDSPWETHYNTFIPHPVRYHDFDKLLADLKAKNIRVVLWITSLVNTSGFDVEEGGDLYEGRASNYDEADMCGFFVNGGQQWTWWKGKGSAIDFFNPKAMAWWHAQQRRVLDAGVSGFKLDFGESYIGQADLDTAAGKVTLQAYSEAYYRDFLANGVARKGREEFVTMVRPYDKSYGFEGRFFARKEHAPVAWVGDNRRDWVGLEDALDEMFISASAGYAVLGSDIGGYLDRDDLNLAQTVPANTEAFLRWTALGALTPFMELHGRANLAPWTLPERADDAVAAWKYWASLHHQLVPFFYSLAEESYAGGQPIMRPIGEAASWPGDYRFHLGEALLVAPIVAPGDKRDVALPEGARYYDWWHPEAPPAEGMLAGHAAADWTRIPLFVREGAIIPLEVGDDSTGLGDASSQGAQTVLVYPGPRASSFVVHDEDNASTTLTAEAQASGGAIVTASRAQKPLLLRVRAEATGGQVSGVTVDGAPLSLLPDAAQLAAAGTGYRLDPATRSVWIRLPASATARSIALVP